jgi:hypothetical protein
MINPTIIFHVNTNGILIYNCLNLSYNGYVNSR